MPDENDIVFNTYGPDFIGLSSQLLTYLTDSVFWSQIISFLGQAWLIYSALAFLLSALMVVGIIYAYIMINHFGDLATERVKADEKMWSSVYQNNHAGNAQWTQVQSHISSSNPNDWRLAIIEADIMLDKVLTNAGYAGNSIGDKLKSASTTTFATLQDAWDAHLIRNKIAHEGGDFILTERIAKEAIIKYQRVFTEFGVI